MRVSPGNPFSIAKLSHALELGWNCTSCMCLCRDSCIQKQTQQERLLLKKGCRPRAQGGRGRGCAAPACLPVPWTHSTGWTGGRCCPWPVFFSISHHLWGCEEHQLGIFWLCGHFGVKAFLTIYIVCFSLVQLTPQSKYYLGLYAHFPRADLWP